MVNAAQTGDQSATTLSDSDCDATPAATLWSSGTPWEWLVSVLGVAALYVATAKLGFLMAIHPGNVTAVWPPSGIALAALLIGGNRLWPGVWLGSFSRILGCSRAGRWTAWISRWEPRSASARRCKRWPGCRCCGIGLAAMICSAARSMCFGSCWSRWRCAWSVRRLAWPVCARPGSGIGRRLAGCG